MSRDETGKEQHAPIASSPVAGPTGLGTSSARLAHAPSRGNDSEGADRQAANGCWPPHFDIPFEQRMNPEVESARAHSLRWAEANDLVTTDEEKRRLDGARFDRLTARAYPDARGAALDLAADWMIWFFLFDDWFDGLLGLNPAAVHLAVAPMIRYLYEDPSGLSIDSPPVMRAFTDLCNRTSFSMSPAWRTRFAHDTNLYLSSHVWEAEHRISRSLPDLDTFIEIRRNSIGLKPSLAFGEPVNRFELAAELALSEPIHQMRNITADVIAIVNDVLSLGKDLEKGETNNRAVLLIRARGWSVEEVVHHLQATVADLVSTYRQLESAGHTLAVRYGLPLDQARVEAYLSMMRLWMRANLDWSLETARYKPNRVA